MPKAKTTHVAIASGGSHNTSWLEQAQFIFENMLTVLNGLPDALPSLSEDGAILIRVDDKNGALGANKNGDVMVSTFQEEGALTFLEPIYVNEANSLPDQPSRRDLVNLVSRWKADVGRGLPLPDGFASYSAVLDTPGFESFQTSVMKAFHIALAVIRKEMPNTYALFRQDHIPDFTPILSIPGFRPYFHSWMSIGTSLVPHVGLFKSTVTKIIDETVDPIMVLGPSEGGHPILQPMHRLYLRPCDFDLPSDDELEAIYSSLPEADAHITADARGFDRDIPRRLKEWRQFEEDGQDPLFGVIEQDLENAFGDRETGDEAADLDSLKDAPNLSNTTIGLIGVALFIGLIRAFAAIHDKLESGAPIEDLQDVDAESLAADPEAFRLGKLLLEDPENSEFAALQEKAKKAADRLGMLAMLESMEPLGSA